MNIYISEFLFNNKERLWDEIFKHFVETRFFTNGHSIKHIITYSEGIELYAFVSDIKMKGDKYGEFTYGFVEKTDDYYKLQILSENIRTRDRLVDFVKGLENTLPRDILIDSVLKE